jgi:large subunit ribosomal protein L31
MKQNIHPTYYNEATVHCACGNTWKTGSTMPDINVEICNKCHPFYTGKEKLVDSRGRVEKFRKRAAKAQEKMNSRPTKKPRTKKQQSKM